MPVILAGSTDPQLLEALRGAGVVVRSIPMDGLSELAAGPLQAEALVLDLRGQAQLPAALPAMKRQHPGVGVVILASKLEPTLMLEAMRAGVNEWVSEPLTTADLQAALARVTAPAAAPQGQVFAFVGAKGGVGTTTVAVNVATALSTIAPGRTLLIDLHQAYGDAALFLGAEPRFSVVDALENTHRLDEAFFRSLVAKTKAGPDLLASSDRAIVAPADVHRVRTLLEFARHHYQYTVLDLPRSDASVVDALELASNISIVANQDLATVRAGGRMAAAFRQRYGRERVQVVVSRYDSTSEIGQDVIERVLGASVKHLLPSNYKLAVEALNKGRPVVVDNHNKLASSLIGLARGMAGVKAEKPAPERATGLLGRLTGRRG